MNIKKSQKIYTNMFYFFLVTGQVISAFYLLRTSRFSLSIIIPTFFEICS